ncbi:molybdopterin molybdotransferase MoeA [Herbiconiux sp. CPCC 205763]|uniref:Molybdopterin molybdenumtransferase n=1 Tax=Herbiconiux aconitum TaxID=2970913 RepID=A0ABT2GPF0_9MICO|nr:molybdopterin molybdotransferase MoeA [Herbiconiux aconitum]MCS5718102.1 molybdopterin molybdotransferase MoeA [Herbiconiux aconitum]
MTHASVLWHDARRLAYDVGSQRETERVALGDAVGRVLADDLVALIAVPHYASSAMDGWAVAGPGPWRILTSDTERGGSLREGRGGDDGGGADDAPAHAEGDSEGRRAGGGAILRAGEAVPIVTGGVIPPGTRGVLRSEHGVVAADRGVDAIPDAGAGVDAIPDATRSADVRPDSGLLGVLPSIDPGEPREGLHVRPAGTEAAAGETVFHAGALLTPAHVAVAAGCGHDEIAVVRRARVALLLSGDEVVARGIPGPGSVRDSFGPTLPALVSRLGAEVVAQHRVGDDFAATLEHFTSSRLGDALPPATARSGGQGADAAPDLIITTGGTGDSPSDHVRPALRAAGAEFLVDGIAVRPGAPALLARLPDGRLVIGLPGNPLAAMLALLTLAHPLLSSMQGRGMPELGRIRIATSLSAGTAPTSLRPYRLVAGEAHPTAWHGAGMLRGLAEADGVLVVPREGAAAGAELEVLPLPW